MDLGAFCLLVGFAFGMVRCVRLNTEGFHVRGSAPATPTVQERDGLCVKAYTHSAV